MPEPGDKVRIVKCTQENPFHEGRIAVVLAREPDWTYKGDGVIVVYETSSTSDGKTSKRKHYCEPAEWQSPDMPFVLPKGHPRAKRTEDPESD